MKQETNDVRVIFDDVENHLGYKTRLKDSTWNDHIIGEGNRTELLGQEERVKKTIENPHYITQGDVGGKTRYNFIRSTRLPSLNSFSYLKVVTESIDYNTHDIVTAIVQSKLKPKEGEEIIYDHDN